MSTFTYYIPQQIKIKGNLHFFVKQLCYIGNSTQAKKEVKRIRKENPGKIIRLCNSTISEYI